LAAVPYDGIEPFPGHPPTTTTPGQRRVQVAVTALLVIAPLAGLVAAAWLVWGRGIDVADLLSAGFFYFLTGFGVTVGFHRLLTHRGFTATPALRAGLAVAGSMSFQGSAIAWVATTAGTTGPRTCGRWPCCRWARAGTTPTTPIRPAPGTAWTAARSTCPPA